MDEVIVVVVFGLLTTWGFPFNDPGLPLKLASPLYEVVIVWLPTVSVEVVKVATPPPRGAVPIVLPASRKVTVPVGVPGAATAETVAVKVTACAKNDGFFDEVIVVVVLNLLTTWGFPLNDPGLPLKLPSPL